MVKEPYILRESSRGIERVSIEDEMRTDRQIFLTEEINADTCNRLLKELMFLEQDDPGQEITLYINSPGGEVRSGLAVYDYMMMISSPIRTVCTGLAASMGAIFFLAGTERDMLPHSEVMIHDPYNAGRAGEKPLELQERLDQLMEIRKITGRIIAERTGKSLEEVYEKTKRDSYFNAEAALEFGLATGILDRVQGSVTYSHACGGSTGSLKIQ